MAAYTRDRYYDERDAYGERKFSFYNNLNVRKK